MFILCKVCEYNLQQQHNIQLNKDSSMLLHVLKHCWLNWWSWEYFHFCHCIHCYLGIMDSVQSIKHIWELCFNCPQSLSYTEWFTWRIHWINNYKSRHDLLMKIKLSKYITLIDVEIIALQKVLKLDLCTVRQMSTWHSMFTDVAASMARVIVAVWLVMEMTWIRQAVTISVLQSTQCY
jgi:hypothetical protein